MRNLMYLLQPQSLRQTLRKATTVRRIVTALLLVASLALPAYADKANSLFNKGRDAEARQNWEQAYEYYKQAAELKPKDMRYRASFARARFEAAAAHVHRGQNLRENGDLDGAMAEFLHAADIDPSLEIAQQEIVVGGGAIDGGVALAGSDGIAARVLGRIGFDGVCRLPRHEN